MFYSFVASLIVILIAGLASCRASRGTTEDYLLASKAIKPWLAGLSLFATETSGFMFVGFIGLIYAIGLSAVWIPLGWYAGVALVLWRSGAAFRAASESAGAQTYSGLLSRWSGDDHKIVRVLAAAIIVIFLSVYAAAQFAAGGKALFATTGLNAQSSALISFVIVIAYSMAGGIRASIWADAVQAVFMIVALLLLAAYGLHDAGGFAGLGAKLRAADPALIDLFGGPYKYGFLGFLAGWVGGGAGVLGQPHVMVTFMVIEKAENARRALFYYVVCVLALLALCMTAGLCARVLLPELAGGDPELALPLLAQRHMPGALTGIFLAGLFAAAMSTADSQVLSSAAAMTNDIFGKYRHRKLFIKAGTTLVAVLALVIALWGNQSVFKLTLFGWSAMAAGFGPLAFLYSFGIKPSQAQALAMIAAGALVSSWWELSGLSADLYSVLPGILASLAAYGAARLLLKKRGV